MIKVMLPKWWDERELTGVTDEIDTYCCSLTPCWYVEIPDCAYEGYFAVKDLTVIEEG